MAKLLEIQTQLTATVVAIQASDELSRARADERFARIDETFVRMNETFVRIDQRFNRIEQRLDRLEQKMDALPEEIYRKQVGFTAQTQP